MGSARKMPQKKERAIAALLSAGSIGKAAEAAGVSERTLRTWMATPDFAQAYRRARQQVVEHSIGLLQQASVSAVLALLRNLNCGRPASEIAAANALLERSTAAIDQFDLLTRLEALEQQAQQGANHAAYNGAQTNGQARGSLG
jgi:hypothetical protein